MQKSIGVIILFFIPILNYADTLKICNATNQEKKYQAVAMNDEKGTKKNLFLCGAEITVAPGKTVTLTLTADKKNCRSLDPNIDFAATKTHTAVMITGKAASAAMPNSGQDFNDFCFDKGEDKLACVTPYDLSNPVPDRCGSDAD